MIAEVQSSVDRKAHRIAATAVSRRPTADYAFELSIAYAMLASLGIKE